MLNLINGPQTIGCGKKFWLLFLFGTLSFLLYPLFADEYEVGNFAYILLWAFMAMGLSVIWGYGGMMSYGQTLFFGVAGYAYGIFSINFGGEGLTSFLSLFLAVGLAAATAAVLGYFMIWGRVSGVFFGIVTLSATLVLAFFLGQTAGPEWAIGSARFNGFNGMKGMPPLNLEMPSGVMIYFEGVNLYYMVLVLLMITYFGIRIMLNSRFGNVVVAIKSDPDRAELLGYDTRKYQLITFVIGSALAGVSGVLYTSWGQFITPASIGLPAAAMPIVWVAFSGRNDITATLVGSILVIWLFQMLTVYSQQAALILMGAMLLLTVLAAPEGFIIGISKICKKLFIKNNFKENTMKVSV